MKDHGVAGGRCCLVVGSTWANGACAGLQRFGTVPHRGKSAALSFRLAEAPTRREASRFVDPAGAAQPPPSRAAEASRPLAAVGADKDARPPDAGCTSTQSVCRGCAEASSRSHFVAHPDLRYGPGIRRPRALARPAGAVPGLPGGLTSITCGSRSRASALQRRFGKPSTSLRYVMKPMVPQRRRSTGVFQPHLPWWFQRGECFVGCIRTPSPATLNKVLLPALVQPHQRDTHGRYRRSRAPVLRKQAGALDPLQAVLQRLDAPADHALVEFDLRHSSGHRGVPMPPRWRSRGSSRTRRVDSIPQPRQFDLLQFARRLCARAPKMSRISEVRRPPVRLRCCVQGCAAGPGWSAWSKITPCAAVARPPAASDLVGFAAAARTTAAGVRATCGVPAHATDGQVAGRLRQQGQFVKRGVEDSSAQVGPDQHGAGWRWRRSAAAVVAGPGGWRKGLSVKRPGQVRQASCWVEVHGPARHRGGDRVRM